MNYAKKNLKKSKIEFKIKLAQNEVENHHLTAVKKLARDVKVAGFRAGKVPAEVAEKHLNPEKVADEAVNSAVNSAVLEIVSRENLQILDRPNIEITKFVPAQILEFTAVIEVVPEIELADFAKLKSTREKVKIDAKDIDEVLEKLRNNAAEKVEVARAARENDEVIIDFEGFLDGEKFDGGSAENFALKLGSKSFIDGFESGILGKKAGEKFDLDLTFPKNYGAKNLAGKPVVFKINLKKVNEIRAPKLDDDFAKKISPDFKTLDNLREDIKKELTTRAEYDAKEKFQDDLLAELAEKSNVEIPEILVEDQENALENQFAQNLTYRGLNIKEYLQNEKISRDEWIARDLKPAAEKRVRNSLILAALTKKWQISASENEVLAMQKKIMAQYSDENLKSNFDTDEAKSQIAQQIIAEKTLKKLTEEVENSRKKAK